MKIKSIKIAMFSILTVYSVNAQQAPQKTFTEKLDGIKTSGKELTKSASTDNSSIGQSGVMGTSVPLVTISSRTMTFPLSLNYSSGIKTEQQSGPVGLGWAMPIGSITRDYGAFEPDYSSTLYEGDMESTAIGGVDGWLNPTGSLIHPWDHGQALGYDAVEVEQGVRVDQPLSDFYHINVVGLPSNSFWNNGNIGAGHVWKLTEKENWKIEHFVKTFEIQQEYSRINDMMIPITTGTFDFNTPLTSAIGVYPYVINGYAHKATSNSPVGEEALVKYEDFESFIITNDKGVQYVFGRPLRGQKFVFSDDPYWSSNACIDNGQLKADAANGDFWKVDYIAEWLLTEIRSADYKDLNGNGIADDGDMGDWIRFEYTQPTTVRETIPFGSGDFTMKSEVPTHREWSSFSQTDQASSLMRERAYLLKVITPLQELDLRISERFDVDHDFYSKPANQVENLGYFYEDRLHGATSNTSAFDVKYPVETMKYDSLFLYSRLIDETIYKNENVLTSAVVLNYADKGSSQELAVSEYLIRDNQNVQQTGTHKPSSGGTFDIDAYKTGEKRGKTTLIGVELFDGDLDDQTKTSYQFEYAYNPSYNEIHKREILRKYSKPSLRTSYGNIPYPKATAKINYKEEITGTNGLVYDTVNHTNVHPDDFLIDFPYQEVHYKTTLSGQDLNNYIAAGGTAIQPQNMVAVPLAQTVKPVKDVYGYFYAENCIECPKAWSLTKIIYPTGGEVLFEYERGEFQKTVDQPNWNIKENTVPLIKDYNEFAKARTYVQDSRNKYDYALSGLSIPGGPGLGLKTLNATFEVELPEYYGIRLKTKHISDKLNTPVEINYEYGDGHFTAAPAEYVQSCTAGFNQFTIRERNRHWWETDECYLGQFGAYINWTDFEDRMRYTTVTGIALDEYHATHFYESVDEILADGAFTRSHYGPLQDNVTIDYDLYNLFCIRRPGTTYEGRFVLAKNELNTSPIVMYKSELFENNALTPYKTVTNTYERVKLLDVDFEFDYTAGGVNPSNTISMWGLINDYSVWTVFRHGISNNLGFVAVGGTLSASLTLPYNPTNAYNYERWGTFKTTLKKVETDYKGMVSTTDYFYYPNFLLEREETEAVLTNDKYITKYEYAHQTYDPISNVFEDKNIYAAPTKTTTYLDTVAATNALSAQMITYDLTSYEAPRVLDQYQYETDVDDALGTFTLVDFDVTSGTHPNWRIVESDVLEYNRFGQPIATRTNRLFNKAVFGFHNATPKATFSYTKNEFDATYSGFEDFDGRHKASDWNVEAYKEEKWFTEELDVSVEPAVSVTAMNNPCNKNIPPVSLPIGPNSYDSRFRNEITIDNLSGLEVGDVVEVELVGSSYAVPNSYQPIQLTSISDIQVTDYQNIYSHSASNYKQYLLCFTTPIEFPESNYQTLPGQYDERAYMTIETTTVTKKTPKYNLSSTYARTGKYSYRLTTLRNANDPFAKTPIRPVKILNTPINPDCFAIPPVRVSTDDCEWTYQASVWLKYALDLGITADGGTSSVTSLDATADAIYRRGIASLSQGTSNVKIICDIWNQSRTYLIEQKVFYAHDIEGGWKQYTVDIPIERGQEVFLDVYVQNEISQIGVYPFWGSSIFVDDICIYPIGAKYEYTTLDKFGNQTFSTNNNDVFVKNTFDTKSRLLKQQNVYGSIFSELQYFEHPNWNNQNNHITQRNWIDNAKYNESRYYIDGFGKTNQVVTADISRNIRIVSDDKDYNERGMVSGVLKPYILYGSTFEDQKNGDGFQKALDTYGTPQAMTLVNYEETPEAKVKEMHAPKMYTEANIVSSQSEYLSTEAITHPYLVPPNNVFAIGSLLVNELVDQEGDKVRTYIDNLGRVIMEEHEIGNSHFQNTNGSLTMIGNTSTNARTWFTYDGAGRIVKVHDPNGKMNQYFYNSLGLVTKSTTADKGTSEMRYDKYGQVRFVRNQKDIDAVAASTWGTDQFKYNKYDEWGRVIESGMIMAAPNSAPSASFPTQIYFDDISFIDDQEFPAINLQLNQLHQQMFYDFSRSQFNSNALKETRVYSNHVLQGNYTYSSSIQDKTYYGYMADGQIAKTEYQYNGLAAKHTFEPVYNGMRQAVGKKYIHPSNSLLNFEWMAELDDFGRVKTNSTKHNSVTTETSTNYYDALGNLLMKGLGNTGNPSDLHIDYFVYRNNVRDQLVNLTSKNFRFGLMYNKKGIITDQYWSTEHFDPTTGATANINHYDYYYDKMDRLIGADYKQATVDATSFDYFDDISTELPGDFNCTFVSGAFSSILTPIINTLLLESWWYMGQSQLIASKSINTLNTLVATYNQVGIPYQNMTVSEENQFLEAYIANVVATSGENPMYYEWHEANKFSDSQHIQRVNLIISGAESATPEDLKYTKSLLSTIPFYPSTNCTPNTSATVYQHLPEFPFPGTETNANKYDVAYWYTANGNNTSLIRKSSGSIKTIQTYTYASGASNRLTSVKFSMNPLPSNTLNYNYDATGNLTQEIYGATTLTDIGYISYNDMPQSITKSSGTSYYRYDASNMRTVKEVSPTDKEYYFEGVVVDQSGNVKSYQTAEGYASPNGTTVDYFYYVKDWQGTNRSVLDATGTAVNAYDHYPYGLRMPNRHFVTDGEGNRYQFTGHQYDEETSFGYHGARYYNRTLARYMSVDPLAEQFFNWSTYNYTMDNPVNLVDPTGRSPQTTYVDKDGKVLDVTNDGKTDIVQFDDLSFSTWDGNSESLQKKENGKVVGQTIFWHDFMRTDDQTTDKFTGPARGEQALNYGVNIQGNGNEEFNGLELLNSSMKLYKDMIGNYDATLSLALLAKYSRNSKVFDLKSSLGHSEYTGVFIPSKDGGVYTSLRVLGNILFGANMEIARNQNYFPQSKDQFWKTTMTYVGEYNMKQNEVEGLMKYPYYGEHKLSGRAIWLGYWGDKYPNK